MNIDRIQRYCLSLAHTTETVQWGDRLVDMEGIVPAPYLARAHWLAPVSDDALPRTEIKRLVRQASDLVFAKLPRKAQAQLV